MVLRIDSVFIVPNEKREMFHLVTKFKSLENEAGDLKGIKNYDNEH